MSGMGRREFVALLSVGAATWPLVARAQQPAMPVIGFLDPRSSDTVTAGRLQAFRHGLKDTAYVEGENVAIEYRWAENQMDRLPALAGELVHRRVSVIVVSGGFVVAFAAKAATTTIPIVFGVPEDPVRLGLVASLARPGGNLTGINFLNVELVAKGLEILRELVPAATRVAVLINPANAAPWGCKSRFLKPAQAWKSMRPSQPSCGSDPTPFSSAKMRFLIAGGFNLPTWRRDMSFPCRLFLATLPKLVG
jgi:putative tryptophan/tyrosine transport system substrate-binding protein